MNLIIAQAVSRRSICWTIPAAVLLALTVVGPVTGQGFDVEKYLKGLDKNNNGRLDPDEMSGRTRGFIERMGFDADRPIPVSSVIAKFRSEREEREERRERENAPALKVPGFGIDKAEDAKGVPGFGTAESGGRQAYESYSREIRGRVEDVLRRYDRNRNGVIDRDEISNARWGSPSPQESDTNRDGRLSKSELAQRYVGREESRDDRGDDRGDDRRRGRGGDDDENDRGRSSRDRDDDRRRFARPQSSSGSSRSSSSRSSSSRSSGGGSSSSANASKYEQYADGLIKQYDTNKSGKLEKEEVSQMRRPPKADADGDGVITKEELIDALTGKGPSSAGSSSDEGEKSSRPSSGRERTSRDSGARSGTRSRRGSSSSFEELDVNDDRHVHMHEFGQDWDQKLVDEFNEKDKNGDGVITFREWSEGGR